MTFGKEGTCPTNEPFAATLKRFHTTLFQQKKKKKQSTRFNRTEEERNWESHISEAEAVRGEPLLGSSGVSSSEPDDFTLAPAVTGRLLQEDP